MSSLSIFVLRNRPLKMFQKIFNEYTTFVSKPRSISVPMKLTAGHVVRDHAASISSNLWKIAEMVFAHRPREQYFCPSYRPRSSSGPVHLMSTDIWMLYSANINKDKNNELKSSHFENIWISLFHLEWKKFKTFFFPQIESLKINPLEIKMNFA